MKLPLLAAVDKKQTGFLYERMNVVDSENNTDIEENPRIIWAMVVTLLIRMHLQMVPIQDGRDHGLDKDEFERPIHPDGRDRILRSSCKQTPTHGKEERLSVSQRRALRQLALTMNYANSATSPLVPPASLPTPNTFRQGMISPFGSKWKSKTGAC